MSKFILTIILFIVCSGCDMEDKWEMDITPGRYKIIKQQEFGAKDKSNKMALLRAWIEKASGENVKIIEGFDSTFFKPKIINYSIETSEDYTEILLDNPKVALSVKKDDATGQINGALYGDTPYLWEYPLRTNIRKLGSLRHPYYTSDRKVNSIFYASEKIIAIDNSAGYKGGVYTFLNPKTGEILDETAPAGLVAAIGFNEHGSALYVAGAVNEPPYRVAYHYDFKEKKMKELAKISNVFSGIRRGMTLLPVLSFAQEKYLLLQIWPAGRSISYSGFVVVDVKNREVIYKDHGEHQNSLFQFIANDNGDLVYLKGAKDVTLTHLKFD